jgi:hypothetical protein
MQVSLHRRALPLAEDRSPLSALAGKLATLGGMSDERLEAIDPESPMWGRIIGAVGLLWSMSWWLLAIVVLGVGVVGALTRLAVVTDNPLLRVFTLSADILEVGGIAALACGVALGFRLRLVAGRYHEHGAKLVEQAGMYGVSDPVSLLQPAAAAFERAVRVCPRALSPRDWAASQVSLGDVWGLLTEHAPTPDGQMAVLADAVIAYRAALTVYTRRSAPRAWSRTLYALGSALARQAELADEADRRRLLGAAVAAYGATIEYSARAGTREEWAGTQAILGRLLDKAAALVERAERARMLTSAINAHRAALEVFTREADEGRWAAIESLLGTALRNLAELSEDTERAHLLEQAMTAFRAAQQVFTRWSSPLEWAALQTEVGRALRSAAGLMEATQALTLLREAVTVFDLSLEVRARDEMPAAWAATQHYLGQALCDQAWLSAGAERARVAEEASAALIGALTVYAADGEAPSPPAHSRVRAEQGRAEALLGEVDVEV